MIKPFSYQSYLPTLYYLVTIFLINYDVLFLLLVEDQCNHQKPQKTMYSGGPGSIVYKNKNKNNYLPTDTELNSKNIIV